VMLVDDKFVTFWKLFSSHTDQSLISLLILMCVMFVAGLKYK
jgi:hypothetical protein